MHLESSRRCRAVRFSVEAQSPVPFMRCRCSICRRTTGSGGFAIKGHMHSREWPAESLEEWHKRHKVLSA